MKYAVIGAGGIGGYFGTRLAVDGNEVVFIARGRHAEAMRRDGLTLKSPLGDIHIAQPEVPGDPADIGFADVILFCVKLWDVDEAATAIKPLVTHDTAVIPFQNGVSVCGRLSEVLGARHVLGGVAKFSAAIQSPGVIRHNTNFAKLVIGERDGAKSWRLEGVLAACASAGIDAEAPDDIEKTMWEKFTYLAPLAGACCFDRAPVGKVVGDPERRARLAAMMEEAVAVGLAKGVALDPGLAARNLEYACDLDPAVKPSMLLDLEAGRRLELDWLNGEIVRVGRELGIETPANDEVYESLKPYAMGPPTV